MHKFEVWCPDFGETIDDAKTYNAIDSEDAACIWAKHHDMYGDGGDSSIEGGAQMNVCVLRDGRKVSELMTVSGRLVPRYTARAAE